MRPQVPALGTVLCEAGLPLPHLQPASCALSKLLALAVGAERPARVDNAPGACVGKGKGTETCSHLSTAIPGTLQTLLPKPDRACSQISPSHVSICRDFSFLS